MIRRSTQQGATLIIVLCVLVLTALIGAVIVRQSMTSLNIATNAQAKQLLFQSSDAALMKIQNAPESLILTISGSLGRSMNGVARAPEIVFCYQKNNTDFFNVTNYSTIEWPDGASAPNGTSSGTLGYCQASRSNLNFFTSGRNAILTQISIQSIGTSSESNQTNPFEGYSVGTDAQSLNSTSGGGNNTQMNQVIRVYAISLMPSMSTASAANINTCLNSHMNQPIVPLTSTPSTGATDTISMCLQRLGVPFATQFSDYNLIQTEYQRVAR
ncbi:pilus assembly protein PilX [Acinetobacter sp. B5B]|uniref:pilus assembly PilX family protein n=1 Tax=Acinetobacter baretiae TaxID=2605383 RepID=UPI0018C34334|nr:pilus assembly protein PilX [Acinetobacter baretiae]MBF7682818.1 pilus assembly protein PilX [Acinetobacter baretiae]MBF7686178.1 pilus assembly protein PilX [Acinetobacter baretiae]